MVIKLSKNKYMKLFCFFILIILCYFLFCNTEFLRNASPEKLKEFINSYGKIAPIVYILLFTFVPLTFFPDAVLAIAGGMAFGVVKGTLYTVIGALLGGSLAFFIASYFGKDLILKLTKNKHSFDFLSKGNREFLTILTLRLIPLIPFDVISYGSGLTGVKFKNFILATLIGIVPGVIVFSNLGDKALNLNSFEFIVAILMLVFLFGISFIMKNKVKTPKDSKEV